MIYFGLCPNAPAMAMDDALHNRQSDARAFKFIRAMQPLKNSEQFVCILHVEARAVVADEKDIFHYFPARSRFRRLRVRDRACI